MADDVLTARDLNRATLHRQLLLERSGREVLDAVEHLVGLQAQVPLNPYTALWSRLKRFEPDVLAGLLVDREVVRIVVMRGTLHLVSAEDCLVLRPLMQPVLDRELSTHSEYAAPLKVADIESVLSFVRPLLTEQALTGAQLRARIAERFPDENASALAYACRNRLALVQIPPRGVWGKTLQVTSTTVEGWLGRPVAENPSIDDVVLRYFAAFGPATVADIAAWSRLTALREVVDRLRPELRTFRDERGRELYDLPEAPRPDPNTPAPPRFLPEYDNLWLSHADRGRFVSEDDRPRLIAATTVQGSVLHDGFGCGTWWIDENRETGSATLVVDLVVKLSKRAASSVAAEGRRLLRFLLPDATSHDVRLVPPE